MKILTVSTSETGPPWHKQIEDEFGATLGYRIVLTTPQCAVEAARDADIAIVDVASSQFSRETVLGIRIIRPHCPIIVSHPELLNISAVTWQRSLNTAPDAVRSLIATLRREEPHP